MPIPSQLSNALRQCATLSAVVLLATASVGARADVPNPSGGPGIGVAAFAATGPEAYLGKGMSGLVTTDLIRLVVDQNGDFADCKAVVVEIAIRKEIEAEIALQQSPLFDPATRVEPGHLIQADVMIEGTITTGGEDEGMSWDIQARNVHTNQIVATDRGHRARGEKLIDISGGIARRLLGPICEKKPHDRSTWTVNKLAPSDDGPPGPGNFSIKVTMNKMRFECDAPDPVAGVICEPFGIFSVTSIAGPSDGACAVHMEPNALTVDISNNDGRGHLMFGELVNPTLAEEPIDYYGMVFVEWPAVWVCEQAGNNPCPCAGVRNPQSMGRYVLLTGDAGKKKITHDMKVISGRCAPSGENQYGGACTGDKPVFDWSMAR